MLNDFNIKFNWDSYSLILEEEINEILNSDRAIKQEKFDLLIKKLQNNSRYFKNIWE